MTGLFFAQLIVPPLAGSQAEGRPAEAGFPTQMKERLAMM